MKTVQCFKCRSCRCSTRIYAAGFDEIACSKHTKDLEEHADATLAGATRIYESGYSAYREPLMTPAQFAERVQGLKTRVRQIEGGT